MAAGESSFDVVSQFDRQELVNAVDQALREVHTRFDLKDSGTTIELEAAAIKLHSASEMTLDATRDVLLQKAVRRSLSPKIFDYGRVEEASRGLDEARTAACTRAWREAGVRFATVDEAVESLHAGFVRAGD